MKPTKPFIVLVALYAVLLVCSNIMTAKLITICGFTLTAGILVFPAVYILSDLLSETYGFRMSMFAIRINFACCALFALLMQLMLWLPHPVFWEAQSSFETVFASTPRIVGASLASYYFGDWLNSAILCKMKAHSKEHFPVRAFVSSIFGQALDSAMFFSIAFIGVMPLKLVFTLALTQCGAKLLYELICLPLTTKVVAWWKTWEGIDITDDATTRYGALS